MTSTSKLTRQVSDLAASEETPIKPLFKRARQTFFRSCTMQPTPNVDETMRAILRSKGAVEPEEDISTEEKMRRILKNKFRTVDEMKTIYEYFKETKFGL